MFSKLLVGLDGSPGGEAALTAAIDLGRRFGSTVLLVAVRERHETDHRARTESAASRVTGAGLAVEVVQGSGSAEDELIRLAQHAEAVVVGRRGRDSPGGIGAVTGRVIRLAPRPVVVAGDTPSRYARPVVGWDGGTTSTSALSLAARYAEATGVPLDVVHVGGDPADADKLLARAGAFLSGKRAEFSTHHLAGPLDEAIPRHLADSGADLLVVGAHGGRGEGRSVGSNAELLIRVTSVPVIVIR